MQLNEAAWEKDLVLTALQELDLKKKMHRSALLVDVICMLVNISVTPGSAGGCDVMLVCAVKSFTPAQSRYQVLAKPLAAGWLRGVASRSHHHHREQGRVQLAQPPRCQSVLVDSLRLFTSLLTKPL